MHTCIYCTYTCLLCQIEQDAYQEDLGFSTGWIGKSSSGKVRGPAASDKTQVSISKRLQVCIYIYTYIYITCTLFCHIYYMHHIETATTAATTTTSVWWEDFSSWDDVWNCIQHCIYSSTSMCLHALCTYVHNASD